MRINSIQPYTYSYKPVSSKNTPSFKSKDIIDEVMDEMVEEIADKYQYVKDPEPLVREELGNIYSELYTYQILARIKEKREIRRQVKNEILDEQRRIQDIQHNINTSKNKEKEIREQIAEAGKVNPLEQIKLSKILNTQKRENKTCEELDKNYIALQKMKEKTYPNAIMIIGMNDKYEQNNILKYLENNNCKVRRMDFARIDLKNVNKEILNHVIQIKNSGTHTILFIDNFNKYTVPTTRNEKFINKLKAFLVGCASKYDTTVLVFESHPKKLDANITGGHRFGVKIDLSDIKGEKLTAFEPKGNGYTMYYDGEENSTVDLYPADLGRSRKIMWIDSKDSKKIKTVIERISDITKTELFNDIEYIQIAEPDSFEELGGFRPIKTYSANGDRIYQMSLYY